MQEKPFQCPKFGKSFQENLLEHEAPNCVNCWEQLLKCSECQESRGRWEHMVSHEREMPYETLPTPRSSWRRNCRGTWSSCIKCPRPMPRAPCPKGNWSCTRLLSPVGQAVGARRVWGPDSSQMACRCISRPSTERSLMSVVLQLQLYPKAVDQKTKQNKKTGRLYLEGNPTVFSGRESA